MSNQGGHEINMNIRLEHSKRGIASYRVSFKHPQKDEERVCRAPSLEAAIQISTLRFSTLRRSLDTDEISRKLPPKESIIHFKENAKDETESALYELEELDRLLINSVNSKFNGLLDLERLFDKTTFPKPRPIAPPELPEIKPPILPIEPTLAQHIRPLNFLERLVPSLAHKKRSADVHRFSEIHVKWKLEVEKLALRYEEKVAERHAAHETRSTQFIDDLLNPWLKSEAEWVEDQRKANAIIEDARVQFLECNPTGVEKYFEYVLETSEWNNPECLEGFGRHFEIKFSAASGSLIVNYQLPPASELPRLKGVRYLPSTHSTEKLYLSDSAAKKQYEKFQRNLALRSIYVIARADAHENLEIIEFNGMLTRPDPATGHAHEICAISVKVNKSDFLLLNLLEVDPEACVQMLKGRV